QTLTPEAQNALLKTLEEPPGNTQLYLTTPSAESFLPTVRSRCHLIDLGPSESSLNEADLKKAWGLWQEGRLTKLFDATNTDPAIWAALARAVLFYKLGTKDPEISGIVGEGELAKLADQLE